MANQNINAYLKLNTKEFDKKMRKVQRGLKKFEGQASGLGRSLTTNVVAPLGLLSKAAFDVAADFDTMQRKIAGISGKTRIIKELADDAIRLGKETRFSSTEVAELQLELKKLGKSTPEILGMTEAVLNLSTAFGLELSAAAKQVAVTMNQFSGSLEGFETQADKARRVTDLFTTVAGNSAISVEGIGEALKYAGPLAEQFGVSLEDTLAIVGTLGDAGLADSQIGTNLRQLFSEIIKSGADVPTVLEQIRSGMFTAEEAIQRFNIRGGTSATILTALSEKYDELSLAIENSAGATDNVSDLMKKGLEDSAKRVTSALDGLSQEFGRKFGPALTDSLDKLAQLINKLSEMDSGFLDMVARLGAAAGAVAAFSGTAVVLTRMVKLVSGLLTGVGGLNPVLTAAAIAIGVFASAWVDAEIAVSRFKNTIDELEGGNASGSILSVDKMLGESATASEFKAAFDKQLSTIQGEISRLEKDAGAMLGSGLSRKVSVAGGLLSFLGSAEATDEEIAQLQRAMPLLDDLKAAYDDQLKVQAKITDGGGFSKYFADNKAAIAAAAKDTDALTDATRDYIAEFEKTEGYQATGNTSGDLLAAIRNVDILTAKIGDMDTAMSESALTGGTISESMKEELRIATELQGYYTNRESQLRRIGETEEGFVDLQQRALSLHERINAAMDERARKDAAQAVRIENQKRQYEELTAGMQNMMDNAMLSGAEFSQAYSGIMDGMGQAVERVGQSISKLADGLATALLDPTISAADAMKEWGKGLAQTVAKAAIEFTIMAALIKTLNLITGGTFGDALALLSKNGQGGKLGQVGGIMNAFSGGRSMDSGAIGSMRGYVAGSDLVLVTGRGINANDRLYG